MSPIINVSNLGYAYPSSLPDQEPHWVLQDVNLSIEEGEFVSIMGPTGGGKTTLCLALNGIVPQLTGGVIRGDVYVDGKNTKQQRVSDLARRVGFVFQEPEAQLFNVSVEDEVAFGLENLGLPPAEIKERVAWALFLVEMEAYRGSSPARLSGGQKQRVTIASVLSMLPKVLVLDEPTANLDPRGKVEVFTVVNKLRRSYGSTVVMVSHESEIIAEFSDRVAVLNDGRIVLEGPPGQVFTQVQTLHDIGLNVPQVSELADCLSRQFTKNFAFCRLDEAYRALSLSLYEPSE